MGRRFWLGASPDNRGILPLLSYRTAETVEYLDRQKAAKDESFVSWCDSAIFSDVTIKYGENAKKTFRGHKLVLSASSPWFANAFTAESAESGWFEITLQDDDPPAIFLMLKACYFPLNAYPYRALKVEDDTTAENKTNELILHHLSVVRVASKYNVPRLLAQAMAHVSKSFEDFLQRLQLTNDFRKATQEVVQYVYGLPAIPAPAGLLRKDLVSALACQPAFRLFGNPGYFTSTIIELTKEISEFAQDYLLESVAVVGERPEAFFRAMDGHTKSLTCKKCDRDEKREGKERYCRWCDGEMKYWDSDCDEI